MEHHKEIIINDLEKECHNYLPSTFKYTPDMPNSLVYMPLIIENNQVGVMTVQSYKKNAYQGIDTTMMRTLASYISVAVANANTYDIIKQNNQKMTDNIRYAQTIQNAILPSEDTMRNALKGELFILYRSKDIVSGDFYWFSHLPEYKKSFVAVVDCTGHGVSGAFMSMVGNALLSEIVNQKHIFDTAEILNLLSDGVKIALRQDEKMNDDGMDMCLCAIEPIDDTTVKVIFSGAKRPLYVVRKATGTMETVTGDIKSIGGLSKNRKNFSKKELILSKGDMIYLTSDGFAHQNNADRKKIGSAYFKKVLETNASLPVDEQKRALEKELDLFLTGVEQRDDITALGIRL
jgi:serine phosphatase RsbU (regulator of sigma subunit)